MAESKVVVYAALAGNVAIAAVKLVAAAVTGSAAMLSEGVHSLVDSADQVLLLVGGARSERAPDATHPFGYGLEIYFWGFIVAVMVFLLGGAVSVYEGVERLRHPQQGEGALVNFAVLGVSAAFEGASFAVGYRQYRKVVRGDGVGLAAFVRRSKDPNLFVTLLEDGAALIGLAIAAVGVGGHTLGVGWADAAASVAIGGLLMSVAVLLANETRSLIAGEAADPVVMARLQQAVAGAPVAVSEIATLQLGPNRILAALTLDPQGAEPGGPEVLEALGRRVREADPRVFRVYFRAVGRDEAADAS